MTSQEDLIAKQNVPACVQERIEKHPDRKWEIVYREPYGRCIVAAKDIKEAEILFVDHPVITGPKQASLAICLGCYAQLDCWNYYPCSQCKWPMCSPECESLGYHPMECKVFAKAGYHPVPADYENEEKAVYEALLPLRCYLQKQHNPLKWKALIALESHNDLREGTELWQREQTNVVDFLINTVQIDASANLLHTITGILDVNCHEVRSNMPGVENEYRVRGLYPLCAMMSHDCSSNTHHTMVENDEMQMMIIASRDIQKGDMITCTYTHLLSGTTERRKHLKYSKFFDCFCDRCKDPTEQGTFFSSFLCSQSGCGGIVCSVDPVNGSNNPDYSCNKCSFKMKAGIANALNNNVYRELGQIKTSEPEAYEKIYSKYKNVFHPRHFHLIGIKHSLSQIYGKVENYLINELSSETLQRKIDCCQDLLEVIDILDPGISRLRGLTKYELHAPVLIKANSEFQLKMLTKSSFLKKLNHSLSLLDDAVYNLQFEPVSSTEGQICQIARASSKELRNWINTVKAIPNSQFLPETKSKENKKSTTNDELTLQALMKKVDSW